MGGDRSPSDDAWRDVRASLDACIADPAFARRLYTRLASDPGPLGRAVRSVEADRVLAGVPHALVMAVQYARGWGPARYELERLALIHARSGLAEDPRALDAAIEAVVREVCARATGGGPGLERRWRAALGIAARAIRAERLRAG